MKPLALAFLTAVALLAQPAGTITDPDAYAVYNAVISSDWLITNAHAGELLIQNTTAADSAVFKQCFPSGPALSGPWVEAAVNSKEENVNPKSLTAQFSLPVPYRLKSKATIEGYFIGLGPGGWDTFHAMNPGAKGYLQLSAVGFDKAHEHAMVYMAHWCNGGCGGSSYHFLQRIGDGWREVRLDVNACKGMA